ncbi:MAG: class I SAM-dependent methyltransferase [Desulfovibrio sp.]|nr:class I SAM-dependent methyltransferase [Desulfovibrio sp.]
MSDWYASQSGERALRAQRVLLRHNLSSRRRAGCALLEINCGRGQFLPLLVQCGFDVTATEANAHDRAAATALCRHADILAASDDCLPFEDDAFDHALLHLADASARAVELAIAEAFRVVKASLLVTFWNTLSPTWLLARLRGHKADWPQTPCNWLTVWRKLRRLRSGRITCAGVPCVPESPGRKTSGLVLRPWGPLAAWSLLLLDMTPPRAVTPLPLRLERPCLQAPEPALEYGDCGPSSRTQSANVSPDMS